jgi:prepilin-type N-terminal cleavage/methylation domain-containing protein
LAFSPTLPKQIKETNRTKPAGASLIELLAVLLIIGVISAFAVPRLPSIQDVTLDSQAQVFASTLRRAQVLATTTSKSWCVAAGESVSAYSIRSALPPAQNQTCDSAVADHPVTNQPMLISLEKGVLLSGPATLMFNSQGAPSAAANYQLLTGQQSIQVSVAALTGLVTVSR